jgi:hypothetical protein
LSHKTRILIAALGLQAAIGSAAIAGPNANFTLPLHVVASISEPCNGYLPVDCMGNRPNTSAIANHVASVFLLVANHTDIAALQAGLEWNPSWTLSFSLFDCLPGQLDGFVSDGPTSVSGVTTFSCVQGPTLAVVGRMFFMAGQIGCLKYRQPPFPSGICVFDCTGAEIDQITDVNSPRLGRVCVGGGGHDACDAAVPVASDTWGAIKASYR